MGVLFRGIQEHGRIFVHASGQIPLVGQPGHAQSLAALPVQIPCLRRQEGLHEGIDLFVFVIAVGFLRPIGALNNAVSGAVQQISRLLHVPHKPDKQSAERRNCEKGAPIGDVICQMVLHFRGHLCDFQKASVSVQICRKFAEIERGIQIDQVAEAAVQNHLGGHLFGLFPPGDLCAESVPGFLPVSAFLKAVPESRVVKRMIILFRIRFLQFSDRIMISAERMKDNAVLNAFVISLRLFLQQFAQGLLRLFVFSLRQLCSPEKAQSFCIPGIFGKYITAEFLHLFVLFFIFTIKHLTDRLTGHKRKLCSIFIHCLHKLIEFGFDDHMVPGSCHIFISSCPDRYKICMHNSEPAHHVQRSPLCSRGSKHI